MRDGSRNRGDFLGVTTAGFDKQNVYNNVDGFVIEFAKMQRQKVTVAHDICERLVYNAVASC